MPKRPGLTNNVVGVSPFGGSGTDTDAEGNSDKRVPLFYDPVEDLYISEQAKEERDDREHTIVQRQVFDEEETWRAKVGFRKS